MMDGIMSDSNTSDKIEKNQNENQHIYQSKSESVSKNSSKRNRNLSDDNEQTTCYITQESGKFKTII